MNFAASAIVIMCGLGIPLAFADTMTATSDPAACHAADSLLKRGGGIDGYQPPPSGLRLEMGLGAFMQVNTADATGAVEVVSDGLQSAVWLNGILQVRGSIKLGNTSPLSSLWPLRKGNQASVDERFNKDMRVRHALTVGDGDTLLVGHPALAIPVIWIRDDVTPTSDLDKSVHSSMSTVTVAFAPSVGFGLVANARNAADNHQWLWSWAARSLAQCAPIAALGPGDLDILREKAKAGDHAAELTIGQRLLFGDEIIGRDPSVGLALLKRAADAGSAKAAYDVALGMVSGEHHGAIDYAGARKYLDQAAASNFAPAEVELAVGYENNSPDPSDYLAAFKFAKAAANQGHGDAFGILGDLHMAGRAVAKNEVLALQEYRQAADLRSARGFLGMAEAYRDGDGVAEDHVAAYAYLLLAASGPGDLRDTVSKAIGDLALILTPKEISAAEALVDHWHPGADLGSRGTIKPKSPAETAPKQALVDQDALPALPATDPHPIEQKLSHLQVELHADLSYRSVAENEILIRNESAISSVSQQKVFYSKTFDDTKVLEAYTLKKNGQKKPVDPKQIYDQPVPGMSDVPMFDDMMQKVIIFPDVEQGDTIRFRVETQVKPRLPGLFALSSVFAPSQPQDDVDITISAPDSIPLKVENHDIEASQRTDGLNRIYNWHYASKGTAEDRQIAVSALDEFPRFFVSNLTDYDALASLYWREAAAKMQVTPEIVAKAADITAGIDDRRAQAEAIYRWVSRHIRYVGIWLGVDSLIPHDAASVLAAGYGDCKDHAVLFAALLKAKDIVAETVLINSGNSYSLSAPPTLASLNHVISYLPDFDLYADTTAAFAPFGILPIDEYGKLGIHIVDHSGATVRLPSLPAGVAKSESHTVARLDDKGVLSGETRSVANGPFSIELRAVMAKIEAAGAERVANAELSSRFDGGNGNFTAMPPFELAPNYQVDATFALSPELPLLSGRPMSLSPELSLAAVPGDGMAGPLFPGRLADDEPVPCFSGESLQEFVLELPSGYRPKTVPSGMQTDSNWIHFKSSWKLNGQTLTMRREFSADLMGPVCIGEQRRATAKTLDSIRDDYKTVIELTKVQG